MLVNNRKKEFGMGYWGRHGVRLEWRAGGKCQENLQQKVPTLNSSYFDSTKNREKKSIIPKDHPEQFYKRWQRS